MEYLTDFPPSRFIVGSHTKIASHAWLIEKCLDPSAFTYPLKKSSTTPIPVKVIYSYGRSWKTVYRIYTDKDNKEVNGCLTAGTKENHKLYSNIKKCRTCKGHVVLLLQENLLQTIISWQSRRFPLLIFFLPKIGWYIMHISKTACTSCHNHWILMTFHYHFDVSL